MSKSGKVKARPGTVRIIGGKWRRRRLAVDELKGVRPTPDRVRETLFNWIGPAIAGAGCLDLFAGTGVLGFEALSRGAVRATLVDRNRAVTAGLARRNDALGATAEIVLADALEFLGRDDRLPFEIVFVDPPYADAVDAVLDCLADRLAPGSLVYLERRAGDDWPAVAGLEWTRRASAAGVGYGLGVVNG